MMKSILLVLLLALTGCNQVNQATGKFTLFETSSGAIYRLNTSTGETEIFHSPGEHPALNTNTLYKGENGKTYQYIGNGKLKELTDKETANLFMEELDKELGLDKK